MDSWFKRLIVRWFNGLITKFFVTLQPEIMMSIENRIIKAVKDGIQSLYGVDVDEKQIQVQQTRSEFEGQLTVVVFPFLRASKKGPEQTGQELGQYLKENLSEVVANFNVVKGFLNLVISSQSWLELLQAINADEQFGFVSATEDSPLVMIEYSSPNRLCRPMATRW